MRPALISTKVFGFLSIIFGVLMIALAACTAATPTALAPTMPGTTPTASAFPTATSVQLESPTPTLAMNTPSSMSMPEIPSTPEPLVNSGHWLVFSKENGWQGASRDFLIMNTDGTSSQPLGLPVLPDDRQWLFLSEPHGAFIAFRTMPTVGAPFDIRADGIDDTVWIIKLPENQVIRKIPLLSDAAWKLIHAAQEKDPTTFNYGYEIPTQLGLVVNPKSFLWSPQGRYLA
jgi:hypothetical protein